MEEEIENICKVMCHNSPLITRPTKYMLQIIFGVKIGQVSSFSKKNKENNNKIKPMTLIK